MPAAPEIMCTIYGSMSRLVDQPQVGLRWKAQDQMMQTV